MDRRGHLCRGRILDNIATLERGGAPLRVQAIDAPFRQQQPVAHEAKQSAAAERFTVAAKCRTQIGECRRALPRPEVKDDARDFG